MTQGMAETLAAVRDNLRLSQVDIKNIGEDFTRTESRVKRLFEEHPSTQRKYQVLCFHLLSKINISLRLKPPELSFKLEFNMLWPNVTPQFKGISNLRASTNITVYITYSTVSTVIYKLMQI